VRKKAARSRRGGGVTKKKIVGASRLMWRRNTLDLESYRISPPHDTFERVAEASIDKNREVLMELAKY